MTEPFLQAKNVSKSVTSENKTTHVLANVSLSIEAGESAAIVGTSGSGKTTLLGLLAGLDLPDSGEIYMQGKEINKLSEDERALLRKENVGFVFQSFQLLPGLTAVENVQLALQVAGAKKSLQKAKDFLSKVGLEHRLHHYPAQLSGGEQQRVAIARAFANTPVILFADEPTGNLDKNTSQIITDLLFSMNQESGSTLLLITHDQRLAENCQKIYSLEAGKCQQSR